MGLTFVNIEQAERSLLRKQKALLKSPSYAKFSIACQVTFHVFNFLNGSSVLPYMTHPRPRAGTPSWSGHRFSWLNANNFSLEGPNEKKKSDPFCSHAFPEQKGSLKIPDPHDIYGEKQPRYGEFRP
jgi:hypothetical protein